MENISYERRVYESVDYKNCLGIYLKKSTENRIHAAKCYITTRTVISRM